MTSIKVKKAKTVMVRENDDRKCSLIGTSAKTFEQPGASVMSDKKRSSENHILC